MRTNWLALESLFLMLDGFCVAGGLVAYSGLHCRELPVGINFFFFGLLFF
jgi:hypothetical protein